MLIFALALLQYLQTVWFDFAWDDKLLITANEYTRRGFDGLADIFTRRVSVPFKSVYRPVPQALYAMEYAVSGGRPWLSHAFNVLWYGAACVLVYTLVRYVFSGFGRLFALVVAALFTVHPMHVEVVANIKSRDEILALCFGLGGILLSVHALERGRWSAGTAGAICFLLACLSKSNAVTLLPMTALVLWYRHGALMPARRQLVALGGIAAGSAALVGIIRHLQTSVASDSAVHLSSTVLNNIFLWTTQPETVIPTALVNLARYVRLFVFPHPLIHLYGYDQIPLSRWSDLAPWAVVAALVGLAIAGLRHWRRRPAWLFGAIWAAVTYSVYSNLVFLAPDTMADRYLFLPSVGLCLIAALGIWRLAGTVPGRPVRGRGGEEGALAAGIPAPRARSARLPAAFAPLRWARRVGARRGLAATLGMLLLAAAFAQTLQVSRDWRNDATLIHNRIQWMPRNAAAQAIYAQTLLKESLALSSPDEALRRKQAALDAFTRAVRIYPDFQTAWLAIGRLFGEQGLYEKAELALLRAQQLSPLSPDAYAALGTLYLAWRDLDLAIPYLEKAILLDPQLEAVYVLLGRAYLQDGAIENLGAMTDTARHWFEGNVELEALWAAYLFRAERYAEAAQAAQAVLGRAPRNFIALGILSSPRVQGSAGAEALHEAQGEDGGP